MIPNNACTLCITAAAGTELAGAYSASNVHYPRVLISVASSSLKVLYNQKAFFTHAAWLDQAFAHCPIFPTAASRRSLDRVSVPVWLIILSDQLSVLGLVGLYPANYLMERGLILWRQVPKDPRLFPQKSILWSHPVLASVSRSYSRP